MRIFTKAYCRYLILLLALLPLIPGCSSEKDYRFTFSRKDGETYIQKLSTTRERDMGPAGIQIDDTLSRTRVTCEKTDAGWDINSQPLKRIMMRNGEEVENPLLDLITKFTITYKLDNEGRLQDVAGYEKLLEAINSRYASEEAENLASTLDIDTLKQREISEWNGRIGDYINKSFSVGDVWENESSYTLPNGVEVEYTIKTHFRELVQRNNVTCVLIEQVYGSTGEAFADFADDLSGSVTGEDNEDEENRIKVEKGSSSIRGKVVRIIDPSTMNIYGEDADRTIEMEMNIPGMGPVPVKITETRTYEYEYGG